MWEHNMTEQQYKVPTIFGKKRKIDKIIVSVPGSKSITNRALLLATLAQGESRLSGVLFSDDSRHFLDCVQKLGFHTLVDEEAKRISVTGCGGGVPKKEASIYVGSAGTAARFLTAYLGVSEGCYEMDASQQMRRRPMGPLIESLRSLGCEIVCQEKEGFFPFTVRGKGFGKNKICVDIGSSSQFLSALLIASVLTREDLTIQVEGSHGMAYIQMTERMMGQFGVKIMEKKEAGKTSYVIPAGQHYGARSYQIEPDVSAACYFYAMAPLLGIEVTVENVHFDSLQGDVEFLRILEQMGCAVKETEQGITVQGPKDGCYHGVTVDMSACSDQAITLAAIAVFADSPTRINGIGHIRLQESDRIHAIVTELTKMGITCEEGEDFVKIYPGTPMPSEVDTYEDHRMAMGFSLIGLRSEGIVIRDPGCCRKTFENYFSVLDEVITQLDGA